MCRHGLPSTLYYVNVSNSIWATYWGWNGAVSTAADRRSGLLNALRYRVVRTLAVWETASRLAVMTSLAQPIIALLCVEIGWYGYTTTKDNRVPPV